MKGKAGVKRARRWTIVKEKPIKIYAFKLIEEREVDLSIAAPNKKRAKEIAEMVYLDVKGLKDRKNAFSEGVDMFDDYTNSHNLEYLYQEEVY